MYLTSLVKRYEGNPLLTRRDLPGADAVFNAGAVKFKRSNSLTTSKCWTTVASKEIRFPSGQIEYCRNKPSIT